MRHPAAFAFTACLACTPVQGTATNAVDSPAFSRVVQPLPGERHFESIRQITNGGENA